MKVIAIVSAKGGVGKTTLTANLATALQREGVATLLVVDMDPQNALGLHFGADPRSLAGVSRASLAGEDWGSVCVQSPSGVHVLPYGVVNESDRVAFERHLDAHPNWLEQQLQGLELPEDAVVLIDTSASMRRAGMWERAVQEARSVLADMGPADRACVMTFDRETRTVTSFEQWSAMDAPQRLPAARQSP